MLRPWSIRPCALQGKCSFMTPGSGNSLGTRPVKKGSPAGTTIRKEPARPQQLLFPVTGVTVQCRSQEKHRELISCSSLVAAKFCCGWKHDTSPEGQGGQGPAEGNAVDISRRHKKTWLSWSQRGPSSEWTMRVQWLGCHHLDHSFHLDF